MRKVTLIRGARQLLTLRGPIGPRRGSDLGNLGIIQDGAVLISDGLIREVGPSRRLENLALARGADEIDASGCVVMPGFVDSYMHLVSGSARTIQHLSPRALEAAALRVVETAVRHGTTAIEAKSGPGATEAGEVKILRVQSALAELGLTLVSTFVTVGMDADSGQRMLPMLRRRQLAEFVEVRCEEGGFMPAQARRYLSAAREQTLGMKVSTGANPEAVALAVEIGATSVDGLLNVTERDARALAQSQTIATLSPGAAFHLQTSCYPPARPLIDNGAAVALATGYHPETSPSESMPMAIALACRTMHMTAAEAISASTMNAAHAMRRADSIGSIEAGKSADLVILGVPDYQELPYHFGVNLVNLVMSRGTVLVKRSEVQWPAR
jgi:imidazolonepropionase